MKDVIARLKERHGSRGNRYLSPQFSQDYTKYTVVLQMING